MCHHGKYDVTLKVQQLGPSDLYHSLAKKGPWAVHITLCSCRQGGGRIFVTLLHFTTKKCPCLHYHNLQDIAHQQSCLVQA